MRQSNGYIILFTAILTIIVGGLLSVTSQFLAPAQKKSIELDTKTQILSSVMDRKELAKMQPNEVLSMYDERIKSLVVDINGNVLTKDEEGKPYVAEEVSIVKNYKKAPEDRVYPVFKFMDDQDTTKVNNYILPIYGAGLWNEIWGFVALNSELKTINGVSFDHKGETPGLGARIGTPEVQSRFVGKEIYDDQGNLVSVVMLKGEGNASLNDHQVDGLSGATITANGVNIMLKNYLSYYESYFKKVKEGSTARS